MAKRGTKADLPESLQALVQDLGKEVTPADIDSYGRIQEIQDRSLRVRAVVEAWKEQQTQDLTMRRQYALWLMWALAVQALCANVVVVLVGAGVLELETWTLRTFILSVFGEIVALVLVVVRYLFKPPSDRILDLLDERPRGGGTRS